MRIGLQTSTLCLHIRNSQLWVPEKYQRNPNLVDFILEEPEALVDQDFSV
jgi:hypothetical protein